MTDLPIPAEDEIKATLTAAQYWGWGAVAIIGAAGAAFFAGSETGLYSVNKVRLRVRAARSNPIDHSANLLSHEAQHTHNVLPAMLIGYNVFSAINALGMTAIMNGLGYSETWVIVINVVLLTPLLFVLADMLPKELFRADADRVMYRAAPLIKGWRLLLTYSGVLPVIQFLSKGLARLLTRKVDAETELEHTRAHIHALLKEGAQHGVMSEAQLTLLDRAFGLRETEVGDEMVPWSRCRVLHAEWPRDRVLAFIQNNPFSRFPLVEGGKLAGVVEYIDLCLHADKLPIELAHPPARLAATLPVRDALRSLASTSAKMGIVVEGGRPIGLVTVKDLVEPLTGELKAW